jgi:8-oxo-dGTP pyrophosphatase MutT (NUDIX family)
MLEFEILYESIFKKNDIHIDFDPSSVMQMSKKINNETQKIWNDALKKSRKKGTILFNGNLYRLLSYTIIEKPQIKFTLKVGRTNYMEYVATRTKKFHKEDNRWDLANPLAVCVVIVTADHKILIEKREQVDVYSGRYHVIGGFTDVDKDKPNRKIPILFAAILREILEETGLKISFQNIFGTGLVYDLINPHPEIAFVANTNLPFRQIQKIKSTDNEIHKLDFIPDNKDQLTNFISENHGNISATGEAALLLYGKGIYGKSWFENILKLIN